MAAPTKPRKAAAKKAKPEPEPEPEVDLSTAELLAVEQAIRGDGGPVDADGQIRPLEIGRAGRTPNPRVWIFTLDGKDYTCPSKPNPALTLRFQRDLRRHGRDEAVANLLVSMLGADALDALAESPDVGEEEMAQVFSRVAIVLWGPKRQTGQPFEDAGGEESDPDPS